MPSPTDPLSKLANRASPHYTATFLVTVAFVFATVCVSCGILTGGAAQAALIASGIVLGFATFGLMGYLVIRRPELLRSEPHLQFLAIMAWSQDPALDEEAVRRRERILPKLLPGLVRKAIASQSDEEEEGRHE